MKTLIGSVITILLICMIGFSGCLFSDSQKEDIQDTGLDIFCQCYDKEGDELKDCVKEALSDAVLRDLDFMAPCLELEGEERRDCLMDMSIQIIVDKIRDQEEP